MAEVPDLPPGFRFHPTDEEIITKYLSEKIMTPGFTAKAIGEVDLNKCEPWELPSKAKMGEKEWYFFCLKDRKYPTGMRTNRATSLGYWKATGKDKEIYKGKDVLVGMKKTLVFYKGRAPKGEKTNWVIHEFRLEGHSHNPNLPRITKDEWVVCKVFHKRIGVLGNHTINGGEGSASSPNYELNSQLVPSSLNSDEGPSSSFANQEEADRLLLLPAAASEVEGLLSNNSYLGADNGSSSYFLLPLAAAAHSPFFLLPDQANLGYLHQEQTTVMKALPADGLSSTVDQRALQERYSNNFMIGSPRNADPYCDRITQNPSGDQQQQVMRSYQDVGAGSSSSAGPTIRFDIGFWKY